MSPPARLHRTLDTGLPMGRRGALPMMPRRIAIALVERGVEGGGKMGRRRMDVEGEGKDVGEEDQGARGRTLAQR